MRIVLGLLMCGHGTQKALGWFHGSGSACTAQLFDEWGFRPALAMVYLAAAVQCIGGLLIILGLATPLAAAVLVGTLVVACAPVWHNGFWAMHGGCELAMVYAAMAAVMGFTGGGRYALDELIGLPQPTWAGAAALVLGIGSAVPVLIRRRITLARAATPPRHAP
jgi:putative oxidoreductase